VIEQQAAMQPDAVAVVDGTQAITYRELNQCANTLARRLGECGLRRGSVAMVQMPRGLELATVLLAVLKAGAAYAWVEPGCSGACDLPGSFCIAQQKSASEQRYLAVDIRSVLSGCAARPSANLPILTRGSDIACVLPDALGDPQVLVPHETVTSMPATAHTGTWASEPGAFDLWVTLMSGATMTVGDQRPAIADPRTVATQAA
jgi:non-ribosomal peptide synthetase component F